MCAKKIAIIGSGCSSVGALWALRNKHYEIHVYERENRLGGHTNTAVFRKGQRSTPVDTGFIALNKKTYRKHLHETAWLFFLAARTRFLILAL